MSDRTGDIRMYVEHLFEGRTLTPETIELKEEIYGNLMARYEDYLAEGMDADEAYRRTCEAVTSVDDVLDGEGAGAGAADGTPEAEKTRVAATADGPTPPGMDEAADGTADKPKRRWSTGKIVGVAVLAFLGVAAVIAITTQVLFASVNQEVVTGQDDPLVVITGDGQETSDTTTEDTTTTDGTTTTNGTTTNGTTTTDGTTTTNGTTGTTMSDSGLLNTAGLYAIVSGHDQTSLTSYANTAWPPDTTTLASVLGGLPLAEWLTSTSYEEQTVLGNTVVAEYEITINDHVYDVDDDLLERALAYNAMAVLSLVPDAETVQVRLREIDAEDGDVDFEVYDFRRTDMESILGSSLTADSLDATTWDSLRTQILSKRVGDRIVDRAND